MIHDYFFMARFLSCPKPGDLPVCDRASKAVYPRASESEGQCIAYY